MLQQLWCSARCTKTQLCIPSRCSSSQCHNCAALGSRHVCRDEAVRLTGPPKKVEAKPMSEAAKSRLDALRGRVAAVREQRQGAGPGQGQGQRQAPGKVRFGG